MVCKTARHSRGEVWSLLLLRILSHLSLVLISVSLQAKSLINQWSFAGVTFKGWVPLELWERDPEIQLCVSCMCGAGGTRHCQDSCSPGKGLGTCPLLRGKPLATLGTVRQFVTSLPARFLPLSSWLRLTCLHGSREGSL